MLATSSRPCQVGKTSSQDFTNLAVLPPAKALEKAMCEGTQTISKTPLAPWSFRCPIAADRSLGWGNTQQNSAGEISWLKKFVPEDSNSKEAEKYLGQILFFADAKQSKVKVYLGEKSVNRTHNESKL